VNSDLEARLYDYYGWPTYWDKDRKQSGD
jgi:hypothetical protein